MSLFAGYIYATQQRKSSTLYLDGSYLQGEEAGWPRAVIITFIHPDSHLDINWVRRQIVRRYGAKAEALPAIRMTREDFLINIPDELSPSDIVEESHEWAGQWGIMVTKFQGENIHRGRNRCG
jgi:hypothetical protein